jgi:hypothetical protein
MTAASQRLISLKKIRMFFLSTSILIFSLPRVNQSSLPYAVSGLDFSIFPLIFCILLFLPFNRNEYVKKRIQANYIYFYLLIIPLLMLLSNIIAFIHLGDSEALTRGVLQSLRRLPEVFFLLLLTYSNLDRENLIKLIKLVIISTIISYILFQFVANGFIPSLSPANDLSGSLFVEESSNDNSFFINNLRIEGNTGSPTTYGLVCGIQLLVLLSLYLRSYIGIVFFLLSSFILVFILLETVAKGVLFSIIFAYLILIFILLYDKVLFKLKNNIIKLIYVLSFILFLFLVSIFIVFRFNISESLFFIDLSNRSILSLQGRFDIYSDAYKLIQDNPYIAILGSGWRSKVVGWHSEFFELIIGYGLPVGCLLAIFQYILIPKLLLNSRKLYSNKNKLVDSNLICAAYFVILFTSLFQDVFHDGNVLYVFSILVYAFIV